MNRIRLWDLPTRIFHWSLLFLVMAAFVSVQIGGNAMVWHGRFGIAILGLIGFRLVWGVVGSTYARFTSFVRGPMTILDYLQGKWQGVGHNPLGALSVLGLLTVLLLQVTTGLFSNDDIAFRGPYAVLVSDDVSVRITGLHKINVYLLLVLVAAHLSAIVFYTKVKKDNLVRPMLVGYKEVSDTRFRSATGGGALALLLAVSIGGGFAWVGSGGLAPYLMPPPPPPAEAPLF